MVNSNNSPMKESSTQNLILQYVYGELDAERELEVRNILESTPEALRYYHELKDIKRHLDSIIEEPNPTSVAIIAEHSHDSHTEAV